MSTHPETEPEEAGEVEGIHAEEAMGVEKISQATDEGYSNTEGSDQR